MQAAIQLKQLSKNHFLKISKVKHSKAAILKMRAINPTPSVAKPVQ
jgi:hypothetical protein